MQEETHNPRYDAQEPNNAPDPWWGGTPPPGTTEQASGEEVVDAPAAGLWGGEVVDAPAADPWSTGASEVADGIGATGWDDWRETIRETIDQLPDDYWAGENPGENDKIMDPLPTDQAEATTPEATGFITDEAGFITEMGPIPENVEPFPDDVLDAPQAEDETTSGGDVIDISSEEDWTSTVDSTVDVSEYFDW